MADSETPRRIRDDGAKYARYLQRVVDEERARGELPSYNDDQPSEITVNKSGIGAKLGLPRLARQAIGIGLGFLLICCGVAIVAHFWPK